MRKTREGMVLAVVGPAGAGKTTLCTRLIAEFGTQISLSISATTRGPRAGEVNGVSKHFRSRDEFQSLIAKNALFEYEEVHGQLYGTLQQTLDESIYSGKDLLLDIDIRGALTFKERLPDYTVICLLLPKHFEVIESRIRSRGGASELEISTRINTAKAEYAKMKELMLRRSSVDYVIVNDQIEPAYDSLRALLITERSCASRFQDSYIEELFEVK